MSSNREFFEKRVWPVVLAHEVGPYMSTGGLVNDPDDPGGWTKWGRSLRNLQGLPKRVGDLNGDGAVNALDIKGMTEGQALELYWRDWVNWGFGRWMLATADSQLMAVKLFDAGTNMGKRRAVICLQRAAGPASGGDHALEDDGIVGRRTRAAVQTLVAGDSPLDLLVSMRAVMAEFYRDIATGGRRKFLRGWLARAHF